MLKNIKISKRLIVGFLIAVLLTSIAGIVGITLLYKSDASYSMVLKDYGFAQGDLGNLGRSFQGQRVTTLYLITSKDEKSRADYTNQLAEQDAKLDKYMADSEKSLTDEGKKSYTILSEALKDYRSNRNEVIKISETNKDSDAMITLFKDNCGDSSALFRETLNTMIQSKSTIGNESSVLLSNQTLLFIWIMVAIIFVAFVVSMILALFISRGISKPLNEIDAAAIELSKGNLGSDITYHAKDEVGSLAQSMRISMKTLQGYIQSIDLNMKEMSNGNFDLPPCPPFIGDFKNIETSLNKFVVTISDTLGQIKTAADQVSIGSDQVSSGSQSLAQGATEQASSVEELSASIIEVAEQVKQNAQNSVKANEKSNEADISIQNSNAQMEELISAMYNINEKSNEISKIIKTIEDIAFQTNILALNAAVEAARAGAAGKGFAVVADEVRNLATKSSEAAKNTTALIEDSINAVYTGTKIADTTAKELQGIVEVSKATANLINAVTVSSKDQSSSINQITLGIDQISTVVQTNSATSEESAAASEELSAQASMMKTLISKFKLKHQPNTVTYSETPLKENFERQNINLDDDDKLDKY